MTLKLRSAVTVGIALGLVATVFLAWSASRSAASTSTTVSPSAATTARGPSNNFGFSKAVQAKIDRLNAELERCLLERGAKRVSLSGGGWTYTDPGGRPSRGCAQVQSRVNAFADSEEYQAAVAEVLPAVEAYAACLARHGVASAHGQPTAEERSALVQAHVACGGSAKDARASG